MSRETAYLNLPFPASQSEPWEESIIAFFNNTDVNLFSAVTDRNLIIAGGGVVNFDSVTKILTWTEPFKLINFVTGFYEYVVDPTTLTPPGPAILLNPGEFLYARQVRGLEDISGNIELQPITSMKLLTSPRKEFHLDTVICSNITSSGSIIFHGGQVLPPDFPFPILENPPPTINPFNYSSFLQTQFFNEDLASAGEAAGFEPVAMKTGEFTGDGTDDRTITTGLVGTLSYVRVWRTDFTDVGVYKTSLMLAKQTKSEDGFSFNGIAFTGSDFTVDNLQSINGTGFIYRWVAFGTP